MSSDDWESASSFFSTIDLSVSSLVCYCIPLWVAKPMITDAEGLALIILCLNLIGTVTKNNLFQGLKIGQRSLSQYCHSLFEGLDSFESIAIYLVMLPSQTKRTHFETSQSHDCRVSLCCLIQAVLNEGFLSDDKKPRKPDVLPKGTILR